MVVADQYWRIRVLRGALVHLEAEGLKTEKMAFRCLNSTENKKESDTSLLIFSEKSSLLRHELMPIKITGQRIQPEIVASRCHETTNFASSSEVLA
ncbi:hypothetical protein Y1Q_0021236 [Alligator mississippiensis]|uniref:Uncharacterized protein n=1 Tax=Alligator mississippiensis TaxID=8496 RepID=A0A151MSB4_ALLMI|nr:hypothetical protein Y1Q_0021236 [Alligator mississippiensis]